MSKLATAAQKYMRSLIALTVAGGGAVMLAAPPAAATEPQTPVAPYRCQLFASEPRMSPDGHEITGVGSSRCTGTGWQDQKITVTLEEQVLPTLFLVVAQSSTDFSSSQYLQQTVAWPCTFNGTATYTIETSWYGQSGATYAYQYPGHSIKLTCST